MPEVGATGSPLDIIGVGTNVGTSIYDRILSGNISQWLKAALIDALNKAEQGDMRGLEMFNKFADPARDWALQMGDPMAQHYLNWAPGLTDTLAGVPQNLTQLFQNSGMFSTPGMEAAQGQLGNLAQGMMPTAGLAGQVFAGGGWTPQYQQMFDRGFDLLGGNTGAQAMGLDIAGDTLGRRGQTQFTQGLQNAMMGGMSTLGMTPGLTQGQQFALGMLGQGGMTPGLQGLQGYGFNTLQGNLGVGGLTPTGAQGELVALQGLMRGGGTPTTDFMQGRGSELMSREALLPMQLAVALAGEQASSEVRDQFEAAQRRALARGGGPGTVVASGLANEGDAAYADAAARAVAEAKRSAMLGQQDLQLKQLSDAISMGQQGGALEANRLATFGDILKGIEGVAANRYGIGGGLVGTSEQTAAQRLATALGAVPGMQNAGTDVMRSLITGGLGGMQGELGQMQLGAGLLNNYTGNQLNALNALGGIAGNQNQYALGAGNLFGNLSQGAGNLYNQQYGNWLGGGQLGNQRATNLGNAWLGAYGLQNNQLGQIGGMWQSAMNPMTQLAGNSLGYAQTWAGNIPRIFQGQSIMPK